jgi:hypothetical protein
MSVVTHLADQQTQTSRTWLTVGIIVTVIVLAVGIFFGYRVLSGSGAASTDTTSNTYTQPITALNVRAESGTLSLSPGSGNQTTVAAKSIWDKQQPTVTQQWDGTTLTVVTSCPGEGKCEVDLTITLPAATVITTDTETGDATLTGMTGAVTVSTGTGEIHLSKLTGQLTAKTDVGSISGADLSATQASATTDTGDVSLSFSVDPQAVSATVGDGDVTITVPRSSTGYHVTANTDTGDRRVRVVTDDSASRTIAAHTETGDVTVDYTG